MKSMAGFLFSAIVVLFILALPAIGAEKKSRVQMDRAILLRAIMLVESNGNPNAIGDEGKARGA